jgi:hypothetical protein
LTGYPTGLVGTIGVAILNSDGTVKIARTTAGITEDPTGDNGDPEYTATLTAPTDAGDYLVQGDDGAGVFSDPEDLIVDFIEPASGDAFASPADLEARLGITLTDAETTRATALLAYATSLIQDAADGQTIFQVTETITMPGRTNERILLPQRPVVSVASITLDGNPLVEGTDWYLDDNGVITRLRVPLVYQNAAVLLDAPYGRLSGFGLPFQTLAITYTHGYATIPGLYKAICLEAVVRAWVNPGSVARETEGNTSVVYDNMRFSPTGLLLTTDEERKIRKQVGKRARGIWIGG